MGEYWVKIDSKGRMKLPKDLLLQLNKSTAFPMVVSRGYKRNLSLYLKDVWEEKAKKYKKYDLDNELERDIVRFFYKGATRVMPDNTDRILLPKPLLEWAGIKKNAVIYAYLDVIEIWDAETYDKSWDKKPQTMDDYIKKRKEVEEKKSEKTESNE